MKAKYKVTLGVLTVMILMTLTVGTSYSYYSVMDYQNSENNLATTCFHIDFTENTSSINLPNAFPISETSAIGDGTNGLAKPYSFTITNTCSENINYVVTFSTVANKAELAPYTNYKIVENNYAQVDHNYQRINLAQPYNNIPDENKVGLDNTYELANGILAPGESNQKTYNFYMWLDENACQGNECQDLIMGKTLEGKIMVYAYL